MEIAIVGGGPAGLRAAEVAAGRGARVTLFDAKPSVGRKLLVAGRGGLNLTHGEALESFAGRYTGPDQPEGFWKNILESFSPSDLRAWASDLGIETFQQRTGRVYPLEMKAAPLLRRWLERLRGLGVTFRMKHRWVGFGEGPRPTLVFDHTEGRFTHEADAVILALGGGSWPITGSDGRWVQSLESAGLHIHPLMPANCGWEHPWSEKVLRDAEGMPLKNLSVKAGHITVAGELMITRYGLEGGAIYQLGSILRSMPHPVLHLDFKPTFTVEELITRMESVKSDALAACRERWKLSPQAHAILTDGLAEDITIETLARLAKSYPLRLTGPRPIDEAISSAGGVPWQALDSSLMLRAMPGVYVAGEMIDWEAPTGGYLMQGCFATGEHAAKQACAGLRSTNT